MTTSIGEYETHDEEKDTSYLLSLHYDSRYGHHKDNLYVQQENMKAVIETLPAAISNDLNSFGDESYKAYDYIKGKLFNNDNQAQTISVTLEDFIQHPGHNINIEPQFGRFYPATLFNSEKLITKKQMIPIRIVGLMHEELLVNTSHPLCDYDTTFTIEKCDCKQFESLQDGQMVNARQIPDFFTGPGMQLRYGDQTTDFFGDDAFQRTDDAIDDEFYSRARILNHLDEIAQARLKSVYSDLIPAHCEILDLMSSINSHLDDKLEIKKVTGLGMNKEELDTNSCLDERVVHNLNRDQSLPFDDASFDIVVCSLSIEYSTQPSKLFDEVARVLRPHGRFIISFSNRWFPTKAIQVWNNLHDFERIGLVMEHFIASAHFGGINTYSLRGIPRRIDDKHNTPLSDPVYVVWAELV